jgi:hypothetical protein
MLKIRGLKSSSRIEAHDFCLPFIPAGDLLPQAADHVDSRRCTISPHLGVGRTPSGYGQKAAASASELNSRRFEGGNVSIYPSRVSGQIYVILRFAPTSGVPRRLSSRVRSRRALAGRLRPAQTSLRAVGIRLGFRREGRNGSRIIRIRGLSAGSSATSAPRNQDLKTPA